MTIDRFDGEYRWLSNFWPTPVELDGETYPSVEHAYQAAKTLGPAQRRMIRNAPTAALAKRHGRTVIIRDAWPDIKVNIMLALVRQKFKDPGLADKLRATGNENLIEGNYWNDTFWGVCKGKGQNHLGHILMHIRAEIQL